MIKMEHFPACRSQWSGDGRLLLPLNPQLSYWRALAIPASSSATPMAAADGEDGYGILRTESCGKQIESPD